MKTYHLPQLSLFTVSDGLYATFELLNTCWEAVYLDIKATVLRKGEELYSFFLCSLSTTATVKDWWNRPICRNYPNNKSGTVCCGPQRTKVKSILCFEKAFWNRGPTILFCILKILHLSIYFQDSLQYFIRYFQNNSVFCPSLNLPVDADFLLLESSIQKLNGLDFLGFRFCTVQNCWMFLYKV